MQSLDRAHGVEQIHNALSFIKDAGLQYSLDLIFAAPNQTLADWQADLAAAIALQPDHLSTYGLTYEKGTPLWKSRERGQVRAAGEDLELAMYDHAIDALTAAGFEHYEISNFAKPGHRCRHNEIYWANHAYYGFGVGAAAYVNGERTAQPPRHELSTSAASLPANPLSSPAKNSNPANAPSKPSPCSCAAPTASTATQFQSQTGFDLMDLAGLAIDPLVSQGLLTDDGESVRLTRYGLHLADAVIESILRLQ